MTSTVLVCLSHGMYVRNVVYSALFRELSRQMKVVLVFPPGVEVPASDAHLLRGASVESVAVKPHRLEKLFVFLRKNVFAGRERTQTFNLIGEMERRKHPWVYPIANRVNAVLGRFPIVARGWQKLEARFIPGHEFDAILDKHQPRAVVTANYGTEAFEVRLLRAAHRRGIPTLALVPSWDNLSSKGVIGENPRHLAVWNRIMHGEAISLYGFSEHSIHVCGGLQFDLYAAGPTPIQRAAVLQRLGIDATRPFIVIGTITPKYFAHNKEIVEIVNDAVERGQLPADLQVVVRLHPQVVDDAHFGDNLDTYRAIAAANPRVKLSIPTLLHWGKLVPPTPEDSVELMTLLQGAAVCIIPASTLAIDACALGTPVVGIGFDGFSKKPYAQSVRRTFDFTHYRRIVAEGGMRIAESREALIEEISAYLRDPQRDREGRERIVASHLGAVDGSAWKRVLGVVEQMTASPG